MTMMVVSSLFRRKNAELICQLLNGVVGKNMDEKWLSGDGMSNIEFHRGPEIGYLSCLLIMHQNVTGARITGPRVNGYSINSLS